MREIQNSKKRVELMARKQKNTDGFDNQHSLHRQSEREILAESRGPEQLQPRDELLNTRTGVRADVTPAFEYGEKHHEVGKRDVELYIRTYNTLLRSSGEVSLKALVQAHYNIESSLHPDARSLRTDKPLPPERRCLLDGDARGYAGRQDVFPVLQRLLVVQLPRWHAHDTYASSFGEQQVTRSNYQADLGSRRDKNHLR